MAAASASTQRRFGINDLAPLDGGVTGVHSKIIGNFTVVTHIEDGKASNRPNFERADLFVATERIGGINRRGGDRFGGGHAQLRACQRQNHGHAYGGACAGIVIRGESKDGSGVDQVASGSILFQPQMKIASREQRGYGFGFGKDTDVRAIYFLQMIAARRGKLNGKLCSAGAGKLLSVDSWPQAVTPTSFEDLF